MSELGATPDQGPDLVVLVVSSAFGTHPPQKDFGSLRGEGHPHTNLVDEAKEVVELLTDYPCEIRPPFDRD